MTTKAFAKVLIINEAGELLSLRRSASDFDRPGGWDFPGGTLEPAEGFNAAVVRETIEEASIVLESPHAVYSVCAKRPWGVGVWIYYVQYVSGRPEVTLSDEHQEAQWFLPDAFKQASEYPKHHQIITYFQQHHLFDKGKALPARVTGRMLVRNTSGKILILRRSPRDPFQPGTWDLPGGRAEGGEDIHETAIRETIEECGIAIQHVRPIYAVSRKRIGDMSELGTWVFFTGNLATSDTAIVLSDEHDAYRWIRPSDLRQYTDYAVLTAMHEFVTENNLI